MEISELFEMTIDLRCVWEKLQSATTEEKIKEHKEEARTKTLQVLEKVSLFCENRTCDLLEDVFSLFEGIFEKLRSANAFEGQTEYTVLVLVQKAQLFQVVGKFSQLHEHLANIETVILSMTNFNEGQNSNFFLSVPNLYFPGSFQIFGSRVLNMITLCVSLGQVYLQQTAVLSQMSLHQKALIMAEKGCELMYRLVERIALIFDYFRKFGVGQSELVENFTDSINDFGVFFDYLNSTKSLFMDFRNPNKNPNSCWRVSNDANLKQLLQRVQKANYGSAGLTKKFTLEEPVLFHISSLVKIQSFYESIKILEPTKFDEKLLHRIILVLVSSIFSVATESRFISFVEIQENDNLTQRAPQIFEKNTSKAENISKEFIQSEKIHLLAIEIINFAYPDNIKIASHFFQSYKKNYSMEIFVIEEEDEQSFSTIKTAVHKKEENLYEEPDAHITMPGKYLKISLKPDWIYDMKKKQRDISTENNHTSFTVFFSAKESKMKPKVKESDVFGKTKSSTNIIEKNLESPVGQLISTDRLKANTGGETQKRQFYKPIEFNFKKQKSEPAVVVIPKPKTEKIMNFKFPNRDAKGTPEPTKKLKNSEGHGEYKNLKAIKSKETNGKEMIARNGSRDHSASYDFLRTNPSLSSNTNFDYNMGGMYNSNILQIPGRDSSQNAKKMDTGNKKNFDRLGVFMNKFSNMISESQKEFQSKYQEKLKDKISGHHRSLYLNK